MKYWASTHLQPFYTVLVRSHQRKYVIRWITAVTVVVAYSMAIAATTASNYTCKNCFEHLPRKALIVTKHKCPHCNEWVVLNQYA